MRENTKVNMNLILVIIYEYVKVRSVTNLK